MSNYPAFIERIVDEKTQLDVKKDALINFIPSKKFQELTLGQKSLLCDQLAAMRRYSEILGIRIEMEKNIHDAK